ncbi:LamG domain-containing protein [Leptospira sp. 201903075]|nr:LamG domain-containing protein [Leptospira chreensis]
MFKLFKTFVFFMVIESFLVCQPLQFNNVGDLQSEDRMESILLECLLGGKYCNTGSKTREYIVPSSLASGLYAWYPLDGNMDDLSGNARHGYFPGGVWPTTLGPTYTLSRSHLPSGAASFNGTDQLFANNFTVLCHEDFAIALWIFPNYVVHNEILGFQASPGQNPAILFFLGATGQLAFQSFFNDGSNGNSTYGTSSMAFSANLWTHIAYVHNGTTRQGNIWVNGVSVGATSDVGGLSCSTSQWWSGTPLTIGYSYYGNVSRFFAGRMDDIWFFKGRQLDANDISTLMNLP